jgi:hypothetical protein
MRDHKTRDKKGNVVPKFESSYKLLVQQEIEKEAAVRMRYFKHLAKIN